MFDILKNKKIFITGSYGFVGKNLINSLRKIQRQYNFDLINPSKSELNLTNQIDLEAFFKKEKPNYVIHLAGKVGGIGINKQKPAEFFLDNILMGTFIIDFSYKYGVEKIVSLAAGCGYPDNLTPPYKEEDFWSGLPDDNSLGYSMAKKNLIIQSWSYEKQYNFKSIVLLPSNLYGPYDNFNLDTSHVVPALIRKVFEAKMQSKDEIMVWGTGSASREFLHVDDMVEAILLALIKVNSTGPYNIGTGEETMIKDLLKVLISKIGYKGKVNWDKSKPDGQIRRYYDTEKFRKVTGFKNKYSLEKGLENTLNWYSKNNFNDNFKNSL